jgi:polyhydroxyalkanoate synthesis regulator phasin
LSAQELSGGVGLDELKNRKKAAIEGMIEKSLHSIQEYNEYLVKSLAHMLDGVITQDEYKLFRDDFVRKIEDAEKSIAHLQIEMECLADDAKTLELVERFKEHGNITELDRRAVVGMIHTIIVHDSKDLEVVFRYESGLYAFPEYAESEAVHERAVS